MSIPSSTHPRTRWRFAMAFGLAGALVVGLLVTAFIWPAAASSAPLDRRSDQATPAPAAISPTPPSTTMRRRWHTID